MSTLKVKLEGTNVTHEGHSESGTAPTLMDREPSKPPESGFVNGILNSPSRTRNERTKSFRENGLGRTIARNVEQQAQASAPAPAPAPVPSPTPSSDYAAMQAEMASLKQQLANLQNPQPQYADGILGDLQRRTAEIPQYGNDGGGYDDDYQVFDTKQVQELVLLAVEKDRQARQLASDEERYRADIAATERRYGKDANFEEVRAQAAQIVIASGGKVLLEEAYKAVSDEIEAKSGRRGSSYRPKNVRSLGQIMEYNQQTGRGRQR